MSAPYKIISPMMPSRAVVAHVPHASTVIPEELRPSLLIDDATLERELLRLTDRHVDKLFASVVDAGGAMFLGEVSRLVCDPERYEDDEQEPAAAVGQGAVYTKTTTGETLAELDEYTRAKRIYDFYTPYHEGLTATVDMMLMTFGEALILDCHSYPTVPLPAESAEVPFRPDLCIGADEAHTPAALVERLVAAAEAEGLSVLVNAPFSGSIVPAHLYGDERLRSVMLEVRRDLFCDETTGEPREDFDEFRAKLDRIVAAVLPAAVEQEAPVIGDFSEYDETPGQIQHSDMLRGALGMIGIKLPGSE